MLVRTSPDRSGVGAAHEGQRWNRPLLPIFLTVFVDVLGLTIVLPLLPFYALHFHATPLEVTLLPASYSACMLVSGPILGRLSDRLGRKPVLVASQIGTCIGFLILANATSLWMLFLGRIVDGCTAGNLSIAQAYISDVTAPEKRTRAFALIGIAFGTGFLIGPGISGTVANHFGLAAPFFLAAALSLASVLTTTFLLPRTIPKAPEHAAPSRSAAFSSFFRRPAPRKRLLEFAAFTFAFSTLIGGMALFLNARMQFGVVETSYVFVFSGLVGALVQGGLIGRLVKRFGEGTLAAIGFACMALGLALLSITDSWALLFASSAVSGFGSAVVRPCLTTLITKSVGRDEQGAALGVSQALTSITSMAANPIAGLFIDAGALSAWALVAAGVSAVGLAMRLRPDPEPLVDSPPVPG